MSTPENSLKDLQLQLSAMRMQLALFMAQGDMRPGREDQLCELISSSSGGFTGMYWFKGKLYKLGGTAKAYWYHNEASSSGAWSDGPMPSPMPDMMYWRTTAECGAVEYILC